MTLNRRLEEIRGYLMLRMVDDARELLAELNPCEASQPEALELFIAVMMEQREWSLALDILEPQLQTDCGDGVFINTAICLHKIGRTDEARRTHLRCSTEMQRQAIFHYNLACYEAQLGEPEAAIRSLKKTFRLDSNYRAVADEDPDLEPIRESLSSV